MSWPVPGGGNSAGQAALHVARYAAEVSVLVRGDTLAASMSRYLIGEIAAAPNILTGNDLIAPGAAAWSESRPPLPFECSLPGVFAVGDVRRGSVKRVGSAVGGAVVVQLVPQCLEGLRQDPARRASE
jgi:thioredoxin reductase